MSFIWPAMLGWLVLVPLLVLGYFVLFWRRTARQAALASHSLRLTRADERSGWRRHLPAGLFLAALALLLVGFARPEMAIGFPSVEGTVMVAVDTSNSMAATDVEPTRLDVAREAAIGFFDARPSSIDVGLVSFTNGAVITMRPTDVDADLEDAVGRLQPQGSTSLGQGLFTALGAIVGEPIPVDTSDDDLDIAAIDIGYHSSSVVLVLSDGENTTVPDPVEVAELAANAGVKVFTVGVGTTDGTTVDIGGFTVATALDEPLLQRMAEVTGGQYFPAGSDIDFGAVYDAIDRELRVRGEKTEVTALVAGAAAVLLLAGAALSLRWFGRVA